MELSVYFNVRLMKFIVCVIWPGKIDLIYYIHFITATLLFTQTKYVAIDSQFCFPDGRFLGVNHTQSHESAH